MQFYHANTVDVHYKVNVDNEISVLVHDDNWWQWIIHDNDTSFMYYFHYNNVIDAL